MKTTVKEIIEAWLKEHGYDGLCCGLSVGDFCYCSFDDFIPCDNEEAFDCQPAYKHKNGDMYLEKEEGQ